MTGSEFSDFDGGDKPRDLDSLIFDDWNFPDPDEFGPDIERVVSDLSVPIEEGISSIPDITGDLHERLEAMGVESPRNLSRRKIKRYKDLFLHPLSLEDAHYVAFAEKRRQERTRYLSVSVADILNFMPESIHQISGLQADQTREAHEFLAEFGVNGKELGEMHDNGDRTTRFAMRSLHRLLTEYRLSSHLKRIMPPGDDVAPFHAVAHSAVTTLDRLYDKHQSTKPKSRDARLQLSLDERDFRRSYSFAQPLLGIRPE